jgi:hypothetical protein
MVTVSVSASREAGLLSMASLVRTILIVEHETKELASIPAIIFGAPLPAQALATNKMQRLVLLGTPIDLERLGRVIVQLDIPFVLSLPRPGEIATSRSLHEASVEALC